MRPLTSLTGVNAPGFALSDVRGGRNNTRRVARFLLLWVLLSADELAFDPNARPVPEVVDLCDADGDGMILDAEFAAAVKRLVAIGKSKKPVDVKAAKRLDLDGDEKLSEQEAFVLCAAVRYDMCESTGYFVRWFLQKDENHDQVPSRAETIGVRPTSGNFGGTFGRVLGLDTDKDGKPSLVELVSYVDLVAPPENRLHRHLSQKDPKLWLRAKSLTKKGHLTKLAAPKEVREHFDEIDADKRGEIRTIELFRWMLAQ
jgi:hypothetical protein